MSRRKLDYGEKHRTSKKSLRRNSEQAATREKEVGAEKDPINKRKKLMNPV